MSNKKRLTHKEKKKDSLFEEEKEIDVNLKKWATEIIDVFFYSIKVLNLKKKKTMKNVKIVAAY